MPFAPSSIEGDVPEGAHLAVLTDESGLATAIPRGATVYLIEDPTRADRIFPMVLYSVSKTKIVFLCGCGERGCTRRYDYALTRKLGHHVAHSQRTEATLGNATRKG